MNSENMNEETEQGLIERFKQEYADRKRREIEAALERGDLNDPFTATILGSALLAKVVGGVAITLAATAISSGVSRALTPGPKPLERGQCAPGARGCHHRLHGSRVRCDR
jgi:hypothetical protein